MPGRSELPVAVVTGGNRGVGLEVCRRLANLGFAVVLGSRDLRRAELAAKELDPEGERITPGHIEVDNSVNIDALGEWVKEKFGRVDAIVLDKDYQARVRMTIRPEVKLQEDSIASIKTKGLIGERYVRISPGGSDRIIPPNGRIKDVEPPVDFEELLSKYIFGKV